MSWIGLGAYHTGVEVSGSEYSFSSDGIFKCSPRSAPPPAQFNTSIIIGTHSGTANDVSRVLRELRDEFPPGSYDPIRKNCNVFSNALCFRLTGNPIPQWVNRLAELGSCVSGVPSPVLENPTNVVASAPVNHGGKKVLTEQQQILLAKLKKKKESQSRP
jgi:hypothetical protein